jgi:hypothetical protein
MKINVLLVSNNKQDASNVSKKQATHPRRQQRMQACKQHMHMRAGTDGLGAQAASTGKQQRATTA